MKTTITIEMDNAAFDGDFTQELSRILRDAAKRAENEGPKCSGFKLRDLNGNTVGNLAVQD